MVILQYAREYWLRTGSILAATFGAIGIALSTIPSLHKYTQVPTSMSMTIVILVLLVTPFIAYVRSREREEAMRERSSHLEAAVFGGDAVVVPSTMHIEQRVSLASQPSNPKYHTDVTVSHLPPTALEIHLEFSWPYEHIFANVADAKWHNSIAARESARSISWQRSGLYGCLVKMSSAPTENTFLRFSVWSGATLAVKSARAFF